MGSGGSLISAGALGRQCGSDTGHRQAIEFQSSGEILSVIPEDGIIRLITLHAPGLNKGHLVLRELDLPDEEKSVLISMPKKFHSQIKRATIYLEPVSSGFTLYQRHENGWRPIEPITLIAPGDLAGSDYKELWAYPVTHLGHFRFTEASADGMSMSDDDLFPMGSVRIGIFPWICAGMLFMTTGILSFIIHKMERRRGN
jgi:hypothetical protein